MTGFFVPLKPYHSQLAKYIYSLGATNAFKKVKMGDMFPPQRLLTLTSLENASLEDAAAAQITAEYFAPYLYCLYPNVTGSFQTSCPMTCDAKC